MRDRLMRKLLNPNALNGFAFFLIRGDNDPQLDRFYLRGRKGMAQFATPLGCHA